MSCMALLVYLVLVSLGPGGWFMGCLGLSCLGLSCMEQRCMEQRISGRHLPPIELLLQRNAAMIQHSLGKSNRMLYG